MSEGRFESRKKRFVYYTLTLISVLLIAVYMIFTQFDEAMGYMEVMDKRIVFRDIPMMLLAGLCGLAPAMGAYVIVLLNAIFTDINEAYATTPYLIAALLYYRFSVMGWYQKKRTAVLGAVISNIAIGIVWNIIFALVSQQGILAFSPETIGENVIVVMPECLFASVVIWLFVRFSPDGLKRMFVACVGYEKDDASDEVQLLNEQMKSRLSRKIKAVIVIEAMIIGISAAGFVSQLLPDMADDILGKRSENPEYSKMYDMFAEAPGEATADSQKEDGANAGSTDGTDGSEMVFLFNNAGVAFIIKIIVLIFNVMVPLIVLADALMQRTVARPIIMMSNAIRDFSTASREKQEEKLNAIARLDIKSRDEIGTLYHDVSRMATEINSYVDRVINEQKLEEDLRVAKLASENKTNFLNNVSHEIRTPINAVLGMDEMILRESKEENIRRYALDIRTSGKTLLSLVNDILDSSKLEAGKMEIISVEYDLASLINDVINMIGFKAKEKDLKLNVSVDKTLPHLLYGDEIRIKQIMINILTNAVKYTPRGQIDFWLGYKKTDEEHIVFDCSVRDTGIGIRKEDIDKLFLRFERIDEEKNRSIEGTGLGMNIVNQLLKLMDGELFVESEYQKGSCFRFTLPQKVVDWKEMGDYDAGYAKQEESAKYKEIFQAPDALILIVDDTPMNITVMKSLLKTTKVQIDEAESGFEALDMMKQKKYDMIFLDHRMPKMDGIETLERMKEWPKNPNKDTPVISLTANAISGARETYLKAGFWDYLSKPIDSMKLERMMIEYLPKEKVTFTEEDLTGGEDKAKESFERITCDNPVCEKLNEIKELNLREAFEYCGNEEVFLKVLSEFAQSTQKKANDIDRFLKNKDISDYTIWVHALKSSSRLIGAENLSKDAKHLEELGEKAKENDEAAWKEIEEKTPGLLCDYRSIGAQIAETFSTYDTAEKETISDKKFQEALKAMEEYAEAYDFDGVDMVVSMLKESKLPKSCEEDFEEIKSLAFDVNQSGLVEKLRSMKMD